ncbi:MAG TPA: hypothetical protein VKV37_09315 [Ktedonobacteraceae bacterium]|jgi:phosphoribosyl-dephospho-CoA transferase|nr:hypothetical protein [Ktedonobacteraceae bacterium]
MIEEPEIVGGNKSGEDPTKCYVCEAEATATCARCKMPVCDEHQQVAHEYITKVPMTLCDECADYYEALVKPD